MTGLNWKRSIRRERVLLQRLLVLAEPGHQHYHERAVAICSLSSCYLPVLTSWRQLSWLVADRLITRTKGERDGRRAFSRATSARPHCHARARRDDSFSPFLTDLPCFDWDWVGSDSSWAPLSAGSSRVPARWRAAAGKNRGRLRSLARRQRRRDLRRVWWL